jgi:hypothetical protein
MGRALKANIESYLFTIAYTLDIKRMRRRIGLVHADHGWIEPDPAARVARLAVGARSTL